MPVGSLSAVTRPKRQKLGFESTMSQIIGNIFRHPDLQELTHHLPSSRKKRQKSVEFGAHLAYSTHGSPNKLCSNTSRIFSNSCTFAVCGTPSIPCSNCLSSVSFFAPSPSYLKPNTTDNFRAMLGRGTITSQHPSKLSASFRDLLSTLHNADVSAIEVSKTQNAEQTSLHCHGIGRMWEIYRWEISGRDHQLAIP